MERMTSREIQDFFRSSASKGTAKSSAKKKNATKGKNTPCMTEHEEQVMLIKHCKKMQAQYPKLALLHAIPNGGQRHLFVATKLKAEGVKRGVPDLDLPVAKGGYHGLRIEMKRQRGGTLSKEQKDWIEKLKAEGYCCAVCHGWQEAWNKIEWYVTLGESICP